MTGLAITKKSSLFERTRSFLARRKRIDTCLRFQKNAVAKYIHTKAGLVKRIASAESMVTHCESGTCSDQECQMWVQAKEFALQDLRDLEIQHTVNMYNLDSEITRLRQHPF